MSAIENRTWSVDADLCRSIFGPSTHLFVSIRRRNFKSKLYVHRETCQLVYSLGQVNFENTIAFRKERPITKRRDYISRVGIKTTGVRCNNTIIRDHAYIRGNDVQSRQLIASFVYCKHTNTVIVWEDSFIQTNFEQRSNGKPIVSFLGGRHRVYSRARSVRD